MNITLKEVIQILEYEAHPALQESYDNSGLILGDPSVPLSGALLALDLTEAVLDEAIAAGFNLIITHHPLVFSGIKRISNATSQGRSLLKAIKNDIAVYAIHTNIDNTITGMNRIIAEQLGLKNLKILRPKEGLLRKLVVFCPLQHASDVRTAIFEAGAGVIGNYDSCSFNLNGSGTFRGLHGSNPFVGQSGNLHFEDEVRIETIYPSYLEDKILTALLKAHPYEEVAYDLYPLENKWNMAGAGMIGDTAQAAGEENFFAQMRQIFKTPLIRHSGFLGKQIKKVAICGGSGSFLIKDAIAAGADVFITADLKYHDFAEAEGRIILADAGHYETEQFIILHLNHLLNKYFPTFAVSLASTCTNNVKYY